MKHKSLRAALKEVDPNLKMASKGRRPSQKDWNNAAGVKCPKCNNETLRVYGPQRLCFRCFYREKGTYLEETECRKCKSRAASVTTSLNGTQTTKVVCPNCGTYESK